MPMRLDGVFAERIETAKQAIAATRYALISLESAAGGDIQLSIWADADGALLRMSVPAQMLDVAREDIASAATRTTSFSLPGDESVRIPASGFGLAASVAKPADAKAPSASGHPGWRFRADRSRRRRRRHSGAGPDRAAISLPPDFVVVRYDKRGVGQSGGRAETSDVERLRRRRSRHRDVAREGTERRRRESHRAGWTQRGRVGRDDRRRARRARRRSGPGRRGRHDWSRGHARAATARPRSNERLQMRTSKPRSSCKSAFNAAALERKGLGRDPTRTTTSRRYGVVPELSRLRPGSRDERRAAAPADRAGRARYGRSRPHHSDRLAELARARNRKVATDVVKVPGVNHLLVPAKTGEVDEYPLLADKTVSPAVTSAIASWLTKTLASIR